MKTSVIDNQKDILLTWLDKSPNEDERALTAEIQALFQKVRVQKLVAIKIANDYINSFKTEIPNDSLLRILRERWLQGEPLSLKYDEAIIVISAIFENEFKGKRYFDKGDKSKRYFEKEQLIIKDYGFDPINARAEWRAYFEYRFRSALKKFCQASLQEHWLSLNVSLYSFIAEQTLPVYRTHIGVPDNFHPKYNDKNNPTLLRENDFKRLGPYQKNYSTIWELVRNNVSSIFYFDKSVQNTDDMLVYEIDPDVLPGVGTVDSRYVGLFVADDSHRKLNKDKPEGPENPKKSLIKISIEDQHRYGEKPWTIYHEERKKSLEEKAYQFGIMRFFIRVGIFNPLDSAQSTSSGSPIFINLLEGVYKKWVAENKPTETFQNKEIVLDTYDDYCKVINEQFSSSKNPNKMPFKVGGEWHQFNHDDKYPIDGDENRALDWVLELIDLYAPEMIDTRVSIFEAGFFSLTREDNTISHIYWMPIIINWKEQWTGGAAFFNSDKRIGVDKIWEKDEAGFFLDGSGEHSLDITPDEEVPQVLITTLYFLSGLFADKLIGSIEESIRPSIERAAAVSIMSRNISHNIGSHVLSYQKNIFDNEINMMRGGVLHDLVLETNGVFHVNKHKINIEEANSLYLSTSQTENEDKLLKLPYLRSLGNLLGYFQERQDYISTFASDRYLYFTSVYFNRNILMNFCGVTSNGLRNIALDHIIYSEGYGKDDIVFDSYWSEGGLEKPLSDSLDFEISLPSGNTGRQGIYTILENFIRNSAKHGQKKAERGGVLRIKITLSSADKDYYQLDLLDNSGKTTDDDLAKITNVLESPLVKPDGTLDERNKGIKEIQIAAAWLRGIQPHQIMDKELVGENKIVTVTRKGNDLQYTLFLRKPKDGLLLVNDLTEFFDPNNVLSAPYRKSLMNWDIQEMPENPSMLNSKKIPYHFVAVHEAVNLTKDKWVKIREQSPVRVLKGVTNKTLSSDTIKEDLYEMWINYIKYDNSVPYQLVLAPEQTVKMMTIGIEDLRNERQISEGRIVGFGPIEARNHPILFREHNDLPNRFDSICDETSNLEDFVYVEGISGGDTTGRLLRNETMDTYWYYKMLETALTKVIIIDERIWRNNLGTTDKEKERNFLRWKKKNIHILSLENDEKNPSRLVLKDLKDSIVATLDKEGTVKFSTGGNKKLYNKSHFISLHQGLMERAVKHCADSPMLKNKNEQEQVSSLFERFRTELFQSEFRVMIHSGRSKSHIMPPNTAFVQLSSLSSSLDDSKYTLCDLFYATIKENYENTTKI